MSNKTESAPKVRSKKALQSEKREALRALIANAYQADGESSPYIYLKDYDEQYAYYEDTDDYNKTIRIGYTYSESGYTLNNDPVYVLERTVYVTEDDVISGTVTPATNTATQAVPAPRPVPETISLLKSIKGLLTGNKPVPMIKQFNDEEMISYEPLYVPPETADGHEEGMSEEEIVKMVEKIKIGIEQQTIKANLFHKANTTSFEWIDAFVSPWPECQVGEQTVAKGQPVIVAKYHSKELWDMRKEGVIKGPSIGAMMTPLVVEETDNGED